MRMRTPARLPSEFRALLVTGQVLDPLWASGRATCAGSESRSGLALALGQQHPPRMERLAAAGEPVLWATGCRSLVYSGREPWARAWPPGQGAELQAGVGVGGDPALGEVVLTAARVLAAPRGGAGNWGPPLGHPVAASCGEGPTLSCSRQGPPHGVESHLGRGVGKAHRKSSVTPTHRKLGVSSSLLPPGWLGKTSSRK